MDIIELRLVANNSNGTPIYYQEIHGASSETKPTTYLSAGSIFVEDDTGKVYFWNAAASQWVEQFTLKA